MKNITLVALFIGAMAFSSCGKEKNCDCVTLLGAEVVETTKKECSDVNSILNDRYSCTEAE